MQTGLVLVEEVRVLRPDPRQPGEETDTGWKQKAVDLIKTDKLRVEQGKFLRTLATDPKRGKKRA